MVCTQCGAHSQTNTKYCTVCGAPMPAEADTPKRQRQEDFITSTEGDEPHWGFVRAPSWPKPELKLDSVNEDEPAPPPQEANDNVREYTPARRSAASDFVSEDAPSRRFNPQPISPPEQTTREPIPFTSVGGYESDSQGYQGNFGRAPQRKASSFDFEDDGDDPAYQPSGRIKSPSHAPRQTSTRKSSSRGGSAVKGVNSSLLFYGVIALLVVLLVVFGVILINKNYGSIGGFFASVFGGSPLLREPEVIEGVDPLGRPSYIVTVYAREGNTVTMRVAGDSNSGTIGPSKLKTLYFPKEYFLPEEPVDGATAELVPYIIVTTPDGEEFKVEVPAITVDVPPLTLELNAAGGSISVTKGIVEISGTVTSGASVTAAGQPLTVNEDGTFYGEYALSSMGVHTINIEARKSGYQIARQTLQVDYTQSAVEITLDRGTIRAKDGIATVKGKTDPAATMQVSGPAGVTVGTPTVNPSTGDFSFTAEIAEVGYYSLTCTLTKDGITTTDTIVVERAPDYQSYTASVHPFDSKRTSGSFKCVGSVTEVYQTAPYDRAMLTMADGKQIIFEYHNNVAEVTANDGKTYNLFCDLIGTDEETGLPLFYVWFIIKPSS